MAERDLGKQQPVEQIRVGESALNQVRDKAFTPGGGHGASLDVIAMNGMTDSIKEFNKTFDPKNNAFSAEELSAKLDMNTQSLAALQQFCENRLSKLGVAQDREKASQYLSGRNGNDAQIVGLDDTRTV